MRVPVYVCVHRYCEKLTQTDVMRALFKPVFSIPFNSANKWSLVVAEGPQAPGAQATHLVLLKGAPEIVVTKCTHYMQVRDGGCVIVNTQHTTHTVRRCVP